MRTGCLSNGKYLVYNFITNPNPTTKTVNFSMSPGNFPIFEGHARKMREYLSRNTKKKKGRGKVID